MPRRKASTLPPAILPAALTKLGELCTQHPPFQQSGTLTYCNQSVAAACLMFGFTGFETEHAWPLGANAQCKVLATSPDFRVLEDWVEGQRFANHGCLVLAARPADPNGHILFLVPHEGELPRSGNHSQQVPFGANVGPAKWTGIKHLGFAFGRGKTPTLYLYDPQGKR